MLSASSSKVTFGFQANLSRAFAGSATKISTSAGRKKRGSMTRWSSIFRFSSSKTICRNSRTVGFFQYRSQSHPDFPVAALCASSSHTLRKSPNLFAHRCFQAVILFPFPIWSWLQWKKFFEWQIQNLSWEIHGWKASRYKWTIHMLLDNYV